MKLNLKIKLNYDLVISIIIASIALGAVGGAIQLTRIISLFLVPFNLCYIINKKETFLSEGYVAFGIFWAIFSIYSLRLSKDYQNGLYQVVYLVLYLSLVYSMFICGKKAKDPVKAVFMGWIFFFLLTVPFGLLEIFTNHHFYTNVTQTNALNSGETLNGIIGKKYAAATYNNYNEYMTALCFGLPYLLASIPYLQNKNWAKFLWVLLGGIIVIILLTASRGALVILLICLLVFILSIKQTYYRNKKKMLRRLIIIGCIGFMVFAPFLLSQISARMQQTEMVGDPGRLMIYLEAFRLVKESGYRGLGPYGFEHEWGFAPHNLWMEIFTQYGIVIMSLIIIISISLLFKIKNTFLKLPVLRTLGIMIIITLPVVTIINSSYMNFSFLWVSLGSILIIQSNYKRYISKFNTQGSILNLRS